MGPGSQRVKENFGLHIHGHRGARAYNGGRPIGAPGRAPSGVQLHQTNLRCAGANEDLTSPGASGTFYGAAEHRKRERLKCITFL